MNIAVFLDEVMPINGPLLLIPGSHRQGVFEAGHDKLTTSYPLWTLDKDTVTRLCRDAEAAHGAGIVAPTGKPGSVLMFHGNLVHASPPNITPYPRKIVYVTFCACSNHITKFTRAGMDRAPRLHADPAGGRRRAARIRPRAPRRGGMIFVAGWTQIRKRFGGSHISSFACCSARNYPFHAIVMARPCNRRALLFYRGCRLSRTGERMHVHALFHAPLGQLLQGRGSRSRSSTSRMSWSRSTSCRAKPARRNSSR